MTFEWSPPVSKHFSTAHTRRGPGSPPSNLRASPGPPGRPCPGPCPPHPATFIRRQRGCASGQLLHGPGGDCRPGRQGSGRSGHRKTGLGSCLWCPCCHPRPRGADPLHPCRQPARTSTLGPLSGERLPSQLTHSPSQSHLLCFLGRRVKTHTCTALPTVSTETPRPAPMQELAEVQLAAATVSLWTHTDPPFQDRSLPPRQRAHPREGPGLRLSSPGRTRLCSREFTITQEALSTLHLMTSRPYGQVKKVSHESSALDPAMSKRPRTAYSPAGPHSAPRGVTQVHRADTPVSPSTAATTLAPSSSGHIHSEDGGRGRGTRLWLFTEPLPWRGGGPRSLLRVTYCLLDAGLHLLAQHAFEDKGVAKRLGLQGKGIASRKGCGDALPTCHCLCIVGVALPARETQGPLMTAQRVQKRLESAWLPVEGECHSQGPRPRV